MNVQEAIAYIHADHWRRHAPGLERMRALLRALGDPQEDMKFIHVAGTNGKGSTCAMMAAVLQAAGYRVGLNTSPHLLRFQERIRVNGAEIGDQALVDLVERVRPAAEAMEEHPTEFERITAIALLYFKEQACDVAVLEVGLGGGLDASNVIEVPEAAVLTAMGMDHMEQLGATLSDIAAAKAGIIKAGGTVISHGGCPAADEVFRRVCRQRGAALTEVDFSRLRVQSLSLEGAVFDFAPYETLRLPLAGAYQARNAAVAVTALEKLREKGWAIPEDAIRRGLAAVCWPGRFEVLREADPVFLLDGAHNPQGMEAAVESLGTLFPGRKLVFLTGIMADKDLSAMTALMVPLAEAFVTITPPSPRGLGAETLRQRLLPSGVPVCACVSVEEGVRTAVMAAGPDGVVCTLGSLYLGGEVRRAVARLEK